MDIHGKVAVVTGGGSGIGRALSEALAAAGASVVIGDLDEAGAHETAERIRAAEGSALAMRADAGDIDDLVSLIRLAGDEFAPVDIFVANAGVIGATGLGTDADWDSILDVNLRAHVRAATLLMPHWKSRGAGHFVSVASAAGLLSQLGAAGYAVTKHAAVGFAEWLAITYGDDGIGVSCVCPLGVDTPLLDAVRAAEDAGARLGAAAVLKSAGVISAEEVAAATVDAVRTGRFMVLPHPEVLEMYRHKGSDYDRWIAGMRRLQQSLG
jgi:NAD(P)-dependent dehydrogenase (short-subunit alcohol dehydrogenase family)